MITPVQQILTDAAVLLEERGWGQGNDTIRTADQGGAMCLNLALGAAPSEDLETFRAAQYALINHLGLEVVTEYDRFAGLMREMPGVTLVNWNDAPGRTAREVTDALRATALSVVVDALAAAEEAMA
ncbi:hypothetical protein CcrKarma_gp307 [Caulobacter virus Karma]|uniref:hypothetical protein n=1 Tax=Caulobacter virus Karma TaxID=1211641 RepID=UPI00028AE6A9|nr:hypothetical protein CcrKarma_gp307 [Caulobacter virus Karma]AFU87824.1 hypothetical protein CcrKarma_gp307 [Caulobacter virus Karma]